MERQISELRNHLIMCGFGNMGRIAAQQIMAKGVPLVVIDVDSKRVDEADETGMLGLVADAVESLAGSLGHHGDRAVDLLFGDVHLALPTYGVLFAAGALIAWQWFMRRARALDVPEETAFNLCFYTILAGLLLWAWIIWRQFRERTIDPALEDASEAWERIDELDDKARGRFWYWWDRLTKRR